MGWRLQLLGERLSFSWMYLVISCSIIVIMYDHLVHVVHYPVLVVNKMDISRLQVGLLCGTDLRVYVV